MQSKKQLSTMTMLLTFALSGCGNSDKVPVYPVRGTIRLEGKPFAGGGAIAFLPMERQVGKTAGGQIAENGEYVLTTYSTGDGSMAGYFRVLIMQELATDSREVIPDGQPVPKDGMIGIAVGADQHIPAAYGDAGASPLRATVEPRSNEINFDLQRTLQIQPVEGATPPGVAAIPYGKSNRRVRMWSTVVLCQSDTTQSESQRPVIHLTTGVPEFRR